MIFVVYVFMNFCCACVCVFYGLSPNETPVQSSCRLRPVLMRRRYAPSGTLRRQRRCHCRRSHE